MLRTILFSLLLYTSASASAGSYVLYNFSDAEMKASNQHKEVVPIASVTKLFTAARIIEEGLDLEERVKVHGPNSGRFPVGTMVSRFELLKAMLIASDNRAADSLAHSYPGGYRQFIDHVNTMVQERGLKNTHIDDASGLSPLNTSTADDLVNFVYSLRKNQVIVLLSSLSSSSIEVEKKKKHVMVPIRNTNPDISKYNILISKTGFTNKAGRCLVMLIENNNELLGLAVLGEKNPKSRSKTVSILLNTS